jgi:hypothetical protein
VQCAANNYARETLGTQLVCCTSSGDTHLTRSPPACRPRATATAGSRAPAASPDGRVSTGTPAWEKQALSATGFKRVGRHSEHAMKTVCRCVRRGPGGSSEPPGPPICFSLTPAPGTAARTRRGRRSSGAPRTPRRRAPRLAPGGYAVKRRYSSKRRDIHLCAAPGVGRVCH